MMVPNSAQTLINAVVSVLDEEVTGLVLGDGACLSLTLLDVTVT